MAEQDKTTQDEETGGATERDPDLKWDWECAPPAAYAEISQAAEFSDRAFLMVFGDWSTGAALGGDEGRVKVVAAVRVPESFMASFVSDIVSLWNGYASKHPSMGFKRYSEAGVECAARPADALRGAR